ncbi:MAG: ABC transporter permease [Rikenellaceae bacterium]|nr:ABC transporter permease [Rikenellaceae bacterium]
MRQFLIFVKKEFMHIFRDPRTILILLLMPAIQIILFGFALSNEVKNIDIAIYDQSHDVASRLVIRKIGESPYFNLVASIDNMGDANKLLQSGKAKVVAVFESNLYNKILHEGKGNVQIITDGTDPNTSNAVTRYVHAIITEAQLDLTNKSLPVTAELSMLYNPQMKSSYSFVPGVMGMILMLICAMMTSISIVREKEVGTMEVLLVSPMKPIFIILSKAVPYFTLSLVNLTTVLLLSVFLLDVPISGSLFWLIIVSVIFILVALSIGLLISTLVDTQVAAMLISGLVFMMPVMLLSGMIFPVENMPFILRAIAQFIPAKWYIVAVKKLMIQGLPVGYVLTEISVLVGMAVVFTIISLKKFRIRLA